MGKANFSDDFKRDAVRESTERGYPGSGQDLFRQTRQGRTMNLRRDSA